MVTLLLLLTACGADSPDPVAVASAVTPSSGLAGGAAMPIDDDPCAAPGSWTRTGQPFVLTWCTGCHSAGRVGTDRYGAPDGVDLDTLADAVAWQDRILARIGDGTMPPGGGPPAAERERLAVWLACGAPGSDSSLVGVSDPVAPGAADTVVVITANSASLEGGTDWILRSGDLVSGSSTVTRVVETYDTDGEDAWLWSREVRDVGGSMLLRWSWDPPLPVGQAGLDSWTVDATLTREDAGGGVSTTQQAWSFERGSAADVDGWSIEDDPTQVLGFADDGTEEGWFQSPTWGITGRWWLDADGAGVVYQQALAQTAGTFLGDFPLVTGDRRGGRLVELEVQP